MSYSVTSRYGNGGMPNGKGCSLLNPANLSNEQPLAVPSNPLPAAAAAASSSSSSASQQHQSASVLKIRCPSLSRAASSTEFPQLALNKSQKLALKLWADDNGNGGTNNNHGSSYVLSPTYSSKFALVCPCTPTSDSNVKDSTDRFCQQKCLLYTKAKRQSDDADKVYGDYHEENSNAMGNKDNVCTALPSSGYPYAELCTRFLGTGLMAEVDTYDFPFAHSFSLPSSGDAVAQPATAADVVVLCDFPLSISEELEEQSHRYEQCVANLRSQPTLPIEFDSVFGKECSPLAACALYFVAHGKHIGPFMELMEEEMLLLKRFDKLFDSGRPTSDELFAYYQHLIVFQGKRREACDNFLLQMNQLKGRDQKLHPNSPVTAKKLSSPSLTRSQIFPVDLPDIDRFSLGIRLLQAHKSSTDQTMKAINLEMVAFRRLDALLRKDRTVNVTSPSHVEHYVNEIYLGLWQRQQASMKLEQDLQSIVVSVHFLE